MAGIELRVLGSLEALRDGSSVPLGPRKQRELLAALILRAGQVVSLDRLAEDLWGERPPSQTASSIHVYVSRLRQILGVDVIQTSGGGYVLVLEADALDAVRFELLAAEGRLLAASGRAADAAAKMREALSLWRGPALDGVAFVSAENESARLNGLRLDVIADRVEAELQGGGGGDLVAELESLARDHPVAERVWALLMVALYRDGRQAEALRAYETLRRALMSELGVDPGPQIRGVHEAILRQDPSLTARIPSESSQPVAPITSFVGRAAELEELRAQLAEHRLVTIVGLGGCGKSRLALEVASAHDVPGGTLGVARLSGLLEGNLLQRRVAAAVGAQVLPGRGIQDALLAALDERPGLLVLDDCEHLIEPARAVAAWLLDACPKLHILATSREPLGVAGEAPWTIRPLRPAESVALFVSRASAANPGAAGLDDDSPVVARVCRRLGDIPLAVELAAAMTSVLTMEQIEERTQGALGLIEDQAGGRAMRAAIEWSLAHLSGTDQALFARLAAFAGTFDLADAENVCGDDDPASVLHAIRRLAGMALISTEAAGVRMRYRLLEPVRQVAIELLEGAGELDRMRRRHLSWFTSLAETIKVDEIDAWYDEARAALVFAVRDRAAPEAGLRLACALSNYWLTRGLLDEGRAFLEAALARAPADPLAAQARGQACALAVAAADLDAAELHGHEAVRLAREAGSRETEAAATINLGNIAHMRGDNEGAEELFRSALELAREADLPGITFRAAGNLGLVARRTGRLEDARRLYEEALAAARAADEQTVVVTCVLNLADLARVRGELDEARRIATEALALARRASFPRGMAAALGTLGLLAWQQDSLGEAAALIEESRAISRRTGDKSAEAASASNLAEIARLRHDLHSAIELNQTHLALAEQLGDRRAAAQARLVLVDLRLELGDTSGAASAAAEALGYAAELGEPEWVASSLAMGALLLSARGEHVAAVELQSAADRIRGDAGLAADREWIDRHGRVLEAARASLEAGVDGALATGATLTIEEASALALEVLSPARDGSQMRDAT